MFWNWLGRGKKRKWELIGHNRDTRNVPGWIISKFASISGSQGTMLIDYPDPGGNLHFRGRTYRYRIKMGNQVWRVYRRKRRK